MKKILKAVIWTVVLVMIAAGAYFARARYVKMSVRQDISDFLRLVSKGDLKLDMQESGELEAGPGRTLHKGGGLPKVTVLRIIEAGDEGFRAMSEAWSKALRDGFTQITL